MALGLNTGSNADILPYVRYDARSGRLHRIDRSQGPDGVWRSDSVDITQPPPSFVMDLAQIEVGWLHFSPSGPSLHLVPYGQPLPPQPSADHKQGFRVKLFAPKLLGGVRVFTANAKSVIGAMDAVHSAYLAAPESAQGLLPVVTMAATTPITSRGPQGNSTNYAPVFRIEKWVPRPAELTPEGLAQRGQQQAPATSSPPAPAPAAPPPAPLPVTPPPAQHVPLPPAISAVHDTEF